MRWRGLCYRAHDPRWAWAPTSGDGAAARGGRFNPAGTPALYLALTVEGMFLEMAHGFGHRFDPLTICCYEVDADDIVDLRTGEARAEAGVTLAQMACPWAYETASGRTPASWAIARSLIAEGRAGLLTPSFATGARPDMANLVLWHWGPDLPHKVRVHDPSERLPKDQSSWQSPRNTGTMRATRNTGPDAHTGAAPGPDACHACSRERGGQGSRFPAAVTIAVTDPQPRGKPMTRSRERDCR